MPLSTKAIDSCLKMMYSGTLYLGLCADVVNDVVRGECGDSAYRRAPIRFGDPQSFTDGSGRYVANSNPVTFPALAGNGRGTISYWFVCKNQSGTADIISCGDLKAPITLQAGLEIHYLEETLVMGMD